MDIRRNLFGYSIDDFLPDIESLVKFQSDMIRI